MSQSPRAPQPDDLLALHVASDPQVSPDGQRVAFVVTHIDREKDEYRSSIWTVPTSGGEPVQVTRGPRRDTAPRWSPDGSALAFLSDRDGDRPQLYVLPMSGGEPRQLTALVNGAGPAVWSPDGTRLAFAARVLKETPPANKEARDRWNQRPRVVTHAAYKADGAGYTFDATGQLFVAPVEGGEARQLTQGLNNYGPPAWSPDGQRLAASRTRDGVADYNLSDIWTLDADGSNAQPVLETAGRAACPSWAPDGSLIACYGTDEQEPGLGEALIRVWTVRPDGSEARNLTRDYDRGIFLSPPPLVPPGPLWSADGQTLTVVMADRGNVGLRRVSVADGGVTEIVGGPRWAQQPSLAPGTGRLAFVAASAHAPGDVYTCAADGGGERPLTRLNADLLAQWTLPQVERRDFQTPHGGVVEGWVILPLDGTRPAPLLVDIHGGPHSYHGTNFPHAGWYRYLLAAQGWAVLMLNPTGSGSYGQGFAHGIRGRWGEYDLPEQMAAVDALVAEGLADPDRLAVAGYSYGGYMTTWVITHTDRFRAAVVGAPVVNQESFFGTSDIGMWFAPWELKGGIVPDRDVYRRLSPINYVQNITTPTLVLHGEADDRCPIGQGEELFVGLVAAGRVPTEFVRYPGASHLMNGTGRPSHRVDFNQRVVAWVERFTLA